MFVSIATGLGFAACKFTHAARVSIGKSAWGVLIFFSELVTDRTFIATLIPRTSKGFFREFSGY